MTKLILGALLFSLQAQACPNLTGEYLCPDDGGAYTIVFSQRVKNGVTIYKIHGDEFPADGSTTKLPDDPENYQRDYTIKYWCDGSSLKSETNGKYDNKDLNFVTVTTATKNYIDAVYGGTLDGKMLGGRLQCRRK